MTCAQAIDLEQDEQDPYRHAELLRGNFTKFPNSYLDEIFPNLTNSEHAIITVVLRKTIGQYGRTGSLSARISNREFAKKANLSERAVTYAKASVADKGPLVILEAGTGQTTSLYTLNLRCKTKKPAEIVTTNHTNTLSLNPPLELPSAPPAEVTPAAENPQEPPSSPPAEEELDAPAKSEEAPENSIKSSVEERVEKNATLFKEEEASSGSKALVTKPNKDVMIVDTPPDSVNPTPAEKEKKPRTKTIFDVCFFFSYFFQIILTWQLVGWYVKTYGVDAVLEKLEIMRRQMGRGLKFENPGGWFRSALKNDYQFSKWDTVKMKADEASKRGEVRSLEESRRKDEEEQKDAERLARGEEVKRAMTDVDREGLKASAYKRMEGKGAKAEFINPAAIAVVENEILTERGLLADAA